MSHNTPSYLAQDPKGPVLQHPPRAYAQRSVLHSSYYLSCFDSVPISRSRKSLMCDLQSFSMFCNFWYFWIDNKRPCGCFQSFVSINCHSRSCLQDKSKACPKLEPFLLFSFSYLFLLTSIGYEHPKKNQDGHFSSQFQRNFGSLKYALSRWGVVFPGSVLLVIISANMSSPGHQVTRCNFVLNPSLT